MKDDYSAPARHGVPLIQGALALLVAGTLVAFSALAFRTGFADDRGREVTAADVGRSGEAVVLPALGSTEVESGRARQASQRVAITAATDDTVVLGTRVNGAGVARAGDDDSHDNERGGGHEKARGEGHHKDHDKDKGKGDGNGWDGRSTTAREEDDDDGDHGGDDSDDSDDSGSRSHRSRRAGKRHHGNGGHSRGHSRGSNSN